MSFPPPNTSGTATTPKSSPTPETEMSPAEDLLCSLQHSLLRLRKFYESHLDILDSDDAADPDPGALKPQIGKVEALIRDLQKVERILAEQSHARNDAEAFDLEAARAELERRLAGLHGLLLDEDFSAGRDGG